MLAILATMLGGCTGYPGRVKIEIDDRSIEYRDKKLAAEAARRAARR